MAKTIIEFDQHGDMKIEAIGFTGNACSTRTDNLLAGMGSKKKYETKKPEFLSKEKATGREQLRR